MVIATDNLAALDAKEVILTLSNRSLGIEPIERRAERGRDCTWRVGNLVVPIPGRWQARIEILISDFEKVVVEGRQLSVGKDLAKCLCGYLSSGERPDFSHPVPAVPQD
jgi:hypothetical protein